MADSQKMGKASSGGMKINEHRFFGGSGSPQFPKGVHTRDESSANGAGSEMDYEDTTAKIKAQQEMGEKKAKAHQTKPGYRN